MSVSKILGPPVQQGDTLVELPNFDISDELLSNIVIPNDTSFSDEAFQWSPTDLPDFDIPDEILSNIVMPQESSTNVDSTLNLSKSVFNNCTFNLMNK